MPKKRYTPEEIIQHLRTVELDTGKGLAVLDSCRKLGITEQTYYRWKKGYGGLRVYQAKRLKGLEQENLRLPFLTRIEVGYSALPSRNMSQLLSAAVLHQQMPANQIRQSRTVLEAIVSRDRATRFKFDAGEEIAHLLQADAVLQRETHQAGEDIVEADQLRETV